MSARDDVHIGKGTKPIAVISKEQCDARCPAIAYVYVERLGLELAFCGHCFDNRWAELFANGWAVRVDLRTALRDDEARRR